MTIEKNKEHKVEMHDRSWPGSKETAKRYIRHRLNNNINVCKRYDYTLDIGNLERYLWI